MQTGSSFPKLFGRRNRFTACAVLPCVWILGMVIAGAAEPPPPPPAEPPKPVREEKQFKFDAKARRDPFAFRLKYPPPPEKPKVTIPANGDPPPITFETREKMNDAKKSLTESEGLFMKMETAESLARCQSGLQIIQKLLEQPNIAQESVYGELLNLRESFFRMSKASQKLKERQDAEREFKSLNVKLTGVVAREKNSQVIVNGKVLSKGGVIPISDSAEIVIYDILPNEVIFLFRDYKMKLSISEGNERDSGQN